MKKEVIAHKNPKAPASEVFRTLRTNIQFMDINKKMKTLLVTSTFSGEGKSWICSNLAVTFAQTGKKVIIIDADMRKGRQYKIFETVQKPGLSNYLSQVDFDSEGNLTENLNNYIQETEVPNLYLITAGSIPPNPSELLVSAQMVKLIEDLKNMFDMVIFDGTPCELVADSIILSRFVDSTIIVTASKKTKKDSLEKVIKNIKNVGGKIAGVVLNKVEMGTKEYKQKYYYGYGTKDNKSNEKLLSKMKEFDERIDYNIVKMQEVKENKKKKDAQIENTIERMRSYAGEEKKDEIQDDTKGENDSGDDFRTKTNEILNQINQYMNNEKDN